MNEMMMLVVGLVNLEIAFKFEMDERLGKDGAHVTFEKDGETVSIIWNFGSMGYEMGLLEAWTRNSDLFQDNGGDPLGYLTAVDILAKLQ